MFQYQQELSGGRSVLPFKGRAVLAATLASALLPFLETPWLKSSFNHSKIQFFEPRQGELPDITKPFLALEHVPVVPAHSTTNTRDASKHIFHPNASVLALGILLCELYFCMPVELMAKEALTDRDPSARNINDDFYTCLDKLQILEDDAGIDYYLATKACLTGDYFPIGEQLEFDDVSVQRLFYKNVVKRLESVIFKAWGIRLEDLGSFDAQKNESYWGPIGREVVRLHVGQIDPQMGNDTSESRKWHRAMSDNAPASSPSLHSGMMLRLSGQLSAGLQVQRHLVKSPEKSLYFFDASKHMDLRPEPELVASHQIQVSVVLMTHQELPFGEMDGQSSVFHTALCGHCSRSCRPCANSHFGFRTRPYQRLPIQGPTTSQPTNQSSAKFYTWNTIT